MNDPIDVQLKLYELLVDQMTKYNAIFWQAPALVAANIFALDRLLKVPLALVALAIFNFAMVFAFHRMVVRQGEIIEATKKAQQDLCEKGFSAYVPVFKDRLPSARHRLVEVMLVLNFALLAYGVWCTIQCLASYWCCTNGSFPGGR